MLRLIEKVSHHDKDERYMALSDLQGVLETRGCIEARHQPAIRDTYVQRLQDESSDVQALACKSLGVIVHMFSLEIVVDLVVWLGEASVSGNPASREVYNQGLGAIMRALPPSSGAPVAVELTPIMLQGFKDQDKSIDNRLACLNCLGDTVRDYGAELRDLHEELVEAFLSTLANTELRKPCSICIGYLVPALDDAQFSSLLHRLVESTGSCCAEEVVTHVQTLGLVARFAGSRIHESLGDIVPLLHRFCQDQELMEVDDEIQTYELKETCLLAFASLLERCQPEIGDFVDEILSVGLQLVSLNPNQVLDDEDMEVDGGWSDEDDGTGGGWSDDDGFQQVQSVDDTWRVRLAAVKLLKAFIVFDSPVTHVDRLVMALTGQLEDMDPTVRGECFSCLSELVQRLSDCEAVIPVLLEQHVFKHLRVDHIVSKSGALLLLRETLYLAPDSVCPYIAQFLPLVLDAMSINSGLELTGVHILHSIFLHRSISTHPTLEARFPDLVSALLTALQSPFPENQSLALDTLAQGLEHIPANDSTIAQIQGRVYDPVARIAQDNDLHHSVKASTLFCLARVCVFLGSARVPDFEVFAKRLAMSSLTSTALQCLQCLFRADIRMPGPEPLASLVGQCTTLAGSSAPGTAQQAVMTLSAILSLHGHDLQTPSLKAMADVLHTVDGSDAQFTTLVLVMLTRLVALNAIVLDLLPTLIECLLADSIHKESVEALAALLNALVQSSLTFAKVYNTVYKALQGSSHSVLETGSRVLALLVDLQPPSQASKTTTTLLKSLSKPSLLPLLILGDLGRTHDLFPRGVFTSALELLHSSDDDTRWAASLCLSGVLLGNIAQGLPLLAAAMETLTSQPDRREKRARTRTRRGDTDSTELLLLLRAVKRVLAAEGAGSLDQLIPVLKECASNEDEMVRTTSSECLGRMLASGSLPALQVCQALTEHPSVFGRSSSLTSISTTVSLAELDMSVFLRLIEDPDMLVARQAVEVLDMHWEALGASVDHWIPSLCGHLAPRPACVTVVDYGGWKEKVDAHLPVRKASYTCLTRHAKGMAVQLSPGLVDHNDIQVLVLQYLALLSSPSILPVHSPTCLLY